MNCYIRLMRALVLTVGVVAGVVGAEAATFKAVDGGKALTMSGPIVKGDAERLVRSYMEVYYQRGFAPERILLNSDGGEVYEGLDVATAVKNLELATVVAGDDECSSICISIFASGTKRSIYPNSYLGVHAVSGWLNDAAGNMTWKVDDESRKLMRVITRQLKAEGAPKTLIAKMHETPPDEVYYLTSKELAGWVEVAR